MLTSPEFIGLISSPWKLIFQPQFFPASSILRDCSVSNTPFSQNTSILSTCISPVSHSDDIEGICSSIMFCVVSSAVLPLGVKEIKTLHRATCIIVHNNYRSAKLK